MAYLFTPPSIYVKHRLAGRGLIYGFPVSQTVWKAADGTWQVKSTPSSDELLTAQHVLSNTGTPQVVPDEVAAELIAAGIGTCIPIEA